ncbi:hypothetical protein C4577_02155 [Candidatus Parcubacteria bacterium]|nr:MAG: hypothetical protein C4577_02155 [Candidatus Parcubacteria bacterium]
MSLEESEKNKRYLKMAVVCRKDLNMPTGKFGAMMCHAGKSFILPRLQLWENKFDDVSESGITGVVHGLKFHANKDEIQWLTELDPGLEEHGQVSMAAVILAVNSLEELLEVEKEAEKHKLINHRVIDSGYSHNKPNTFVCLAIGPHWPEQLQPVTGHLKRYR